MRPVYEKRFGKMRAIELVCLFVCFEWEESGH